MTSSPAFRRPLSLVARSIVARSIVGAAVVLSVPTASLAQAPPPADANRANATPAEAPSVIPPNAGPASSAPLPEGPPAVRPGPTEDVPGEPAIGRAVYVGDELLMDYRPRPALVTPVHLIDRPKFPVTDVHCHWSLEQSPEQMIAAMDKLGVARAVNLSGGWGDTLDQQLARFHDHAPDRLLIFATLDYDGIDEPGWGERTAAYLETMHGRGVRGLKVWKNLGLTLRDATGELVKIDDPRLDPVWAKCGELKMPVLIHSADPSPFFEPTDQFNERWMQLQRHPDWSFYGPQFPPKAEVLAQRDRMIARHPETTFIAAHIGDDAEDLAASAARLDAMPNMNVDFSGRVGELGRQPYAARAFLIKYQDRVCFGTDRYPRPARPAAVHDLLPLFGDGRRVLRLLRPPVPAQRRLEDLRRVPARRGAAEGVRRERRPAAGVRRGGRIVGDDLPRPGGVPPVPPPEREGETTRTPPCPTPSSSPSCSPAACSRSASRCGRRSGRWRRCSCRRRSSAGSSGSGLVQAGLRLPADGSPLRATTEAVAGVLSGWPGVLISVVFAGLLLEKPADSAGGRFGAAAGRAARQGLVVWIIVFGQIVVGLAATWAFILPSHPEIPASFGQLIESGFAGGHGTAGAMGAIYADNLGFRPGRDLAFLFATVGLIWGVVSGIGFVNLGVRRGWTATRIPAGVTAGSSDADARPGAATPRGPAGQNEYAAPSTPRRVVTPTPMAFARVPGEVIDPFVFQSLIVAGAFAAGLLMQWAFITLATVVLGPDNPAVAREPIEFIGNVPLFLFTLIGGWLVREAMWAAGIGQLIDPPSVKRIVAAAMEFLIVAAIATLKVSALATYLGPVLILLGVGAAWCALCLLVVSRRLLPGRHWFELGLINYGMSTATTAQGMMLLRIVDRDLQTGAAEDYAAAAPLSAPFVGGGLVTFLLPAFLTRGNVGWVALAGAVLLVGLYALGEGLARRDRAAAHS